MSYIEIWYHFFEETIIKLIVADIRLSLFTEAPEFAHQQEYGAEVGRFRSRQSVRDPGALLQRRSGYPLVNGWIFHSFILWPISYDTGYYQVSTTGCSIRSQAL